MPYNNFLIFLSIAVICGCIGTYFFFKNGKEGQPYSLKTANFSMVFIALFLVLIIMSFDPASTGSGTAFGFKLGGAAALFVVFFLLASKRIIGVHDKDKMLQKIHDYEKQAIQPIPFQNAKFIDYKLKGTADKIIGLVTGNIINVKNIDVWVNSENTNMQMARFYEKSISGIIRYYGAEKNNIGRVQKDLIADALAKEMGDSFYVEPGHVLVTDSYKLKETNGVQKIIHCASVQGEVGGDYSAIGKLENCVTNSLKKMDGIKSETPLKTIIFPRIGTGRGKGEPMEIASKLINAAIEYLKNNQESQIQKVYFLAYTDRSLALYEKVINEKSADLQRLK